MNKPFKFKQFIIKQDKAAMKVGTDGVLLGAWASVEEAACALDIGTGTGLIALMLAQRNAGLQITGIEIEKDAAPQAKENVLSSNWAERISIEHSSLQSFVPNRKFDLIVSNPPFFSRGGASRDSKRSMARSTSTLTYYQLIEGTSRLLLPDGKAAFILPKEEEEFFLNISRGYGLYPDRVTRVRGAITSKIKRSLIQLSRIEKKPLINELVIEIKRHQYTKDYISLVKDFYLKME